MQTFTAVTLSILLCQQAIAGAYKCNRGGQILYSDQPCPGGIEIRLDQAPPPPPRQPDRLEIIYQNNAPGYRYNRKQRDRLYKTTRQLEQYNRQLLQQIRKIEQRREQELRKAAISNRDAMTTINLYWQRKTDALQREFQHNQVQINRLRDMASRRD